ncbi:MAG: hypothetical protein JHC57_16050 [Sphingopyxis sp.]|uniref:hypothetical protein n=1 Tax=Sphingopyxis sp. TaxID=1908224 RepID=UPI001A321FB2|nr:hypothetical protein [Sphingopyxis sp.]MBJ7501269.1 hypothetical protein [Sphingopyxis sp.]
MPRKLSFSAIRDGGPRAVRWLALLLAGIAGGTMLGDMAAGTRPGAETGGPASYSHLSANPDALVAVGESAAPCPGCADSYGAAARLRADREDRMSEGFRALGAVDIEAHVSPEPADDGYRYGGRFPDPPPRVEDPAPQDDPGTGADVAAEEAATPSGDY